jgi:hypothetical protein
MLIAPEGNGAAGAHKAHPIDRADAKLMEQP